MNYQITQILLQHVSQEGRIAFFGKSKDKFKEKFSETGLLSQNVRELLNKCITDALSDFTKAVELNPKDCTARTTLANILVDLGKFKEAKKELETAKIHAEHPNAIERINFDLNRIKKFS